MRKLAIFGLISFTGMASAQPVFPEGKAVPRSFTPEERDWVQSNPILLPAVVTEPPTGPIMCPGEYAPMEGIILAWEGPSDWLDIVAQMAAKITTTGNAIAYVSIDAVGENTTCNTRVTSFGGDISRIRYVSRVNDTIWIRDYGPRYIYEGAGPRPVRAIVDHTYNRPRPNDDTWDNGWSTSRGHQYYELPLIHGGGNYHLSSAQPAFATQLIQNENPGLSIATIIDTWHRYQNVNTTITLPFPQEIDVTQHIDMWMYMAGDQNVLISDWAANRGSTQDTICNAQAAAMAAAGYTVTRLPARSIFGTHYTYANGVMCNDLVLIPKYPTTLGATLDQQALDAWQSALPGKTIVQINCESLVTSAGVMHCICMHVPAFKGRVEANGVAPTVFLRNFRGGQVLANSSVHTVRWATDDDAGPVFRVTISQSLDSGTTWTDLLTNVTNTGSYNWTTPATTQPHVRLRVTAIDSVLLTETDASETDIYVGVLCPADFNRDGVSDFFDYLDFVNAFAANAPGADFNNDQVIDFFDYLDFVDRFSLGCP